MSDAFRNPFTISYEEQTQDQYSLLAITKSPERNDFDVVAVCRVSGVASPREVREAVGSTGDWVRRQALSTRQVLALPASEAALPIEHAVREVAEVEALATAQAHLEELMGDLEDYDDEFLKPSIHAYGRARDWLCGTALLLGQAFSSPSVSPSGDGGVRIEWFTPGGSVRLVVAASLEGMSYIHHRSGDASELWPLSEGKTPVDLAGLLKARNR